MLTTSGTYNFQSVQVEIFIREAFENIGVLGEFVEPQKLDSARRALNLIQLEWINRGVNLWTRETAYLSLVPNQTKYTLPFIVNDIIQANIRTFSRQLAGVPQTNTGVTYDGAGGGNALNAFDDNFSTSCTQNAPNGNISYDYGVAITQQINFIGIRSNTNTSYSLVIECSQDTVIWVPLLIIPAQPYIAGVTAWFDIPASVLARAYRVRETGGQVLNLQEVYFNNNTVDTQMSNISRYDYYTYTNQQLASRPNVYYLDRQITPVLNLWPAPSSIYTCLQYSYTQMIQDVGSLAVDTIQVPARFYPAMMWELSWRMAIKYNPQQSEMFKATYMESFRLASEQDTEKTNTTIYGDYGRYY